LIFKKYSNFNQIFVFVIRNEGLRVAFIHVDESTTDSTAPRVFYSKLVKADINGKDQVEKSFYYCHFSLIIMHSLASGVTVCFLCYMFASRSMKHRHDTGTDTDNNLIKCHISVSS